jgi:hypothetical protein
MAEQEHKTGSTESRPEQQAVSRRRMLKTLGGAATVSAGAVLVGPAAAGATGTGTKTGPAYFRGSPAVVANGNVAGPIDVVPDATVEAFADKGVAVYAWSRAESGEGGGVFGTCFTPDGCAVQGISQATSGSAIGVYGESFSRTGIAVKGRSSGDGAFGVVGLNDGTSGTGAGVHGESSSPSGSAVEGLNFATSGEEAIGVYGQSASTFGAGVEGLNTSTSGFADGVYGESVSPKGRGVTGTNLATNGNAVGVSGGTSSPDGYAVAGLNTAKSGRSVGVYGETGNTSTGFGVLSKGKIGTTSVVISGFPFFGGLRAVYSMASPECWLEDFGSANLVDGAADVALDAVFSAAVRTDSYKVFVVPEGDCRGLYVAAKGEQGFAVRELQGGAASVPFSYRVVARRSDVDAPRLAEVDLSPLASEARHRTPRSARKALLA